MINYGLLIRTTTVFKMGVKCLCLSSSQAYQPIFLLSCNHITHTQISYAPLECYTNIMREPSFPYYYCLHVMTLQRTGCDFHLQKKLITSYAMMGRSYLGWFVQIEGVRFELPFRHWSVLTKCIWWDTTVLVGLAFLNWIGNGADHLLIAGRSVSLRIC